MRQYLDLIRHIKQNGVYKGDRTGTGTQSVFGHQMRFDLMDGFPIVTSKFTSFKLVVTELLWFLKGNPDISYLHKHNNYIWDEWVKPDGTFGPIYGKQWRSWGGSTRQVDEDLNTTAYGVEGIDQIANVIETLKTNPNDRRMIVSAWNVADVESGDMALPPCHVLFQFYTAPMTLWQRVRTLGHTTNDMAACISPGKIEHPERLAELLDEADVPTLALSCQLYQRSCDTFLGVPFNIASYALLTHMIAKVVGMGVGDFIWTGGDVHLYSNHQDQVDELLARHTHKLPKLQLSLGVDNIDGFKPEDIWLEGYSHSGPIKAPVAV